MGKKVVKMLKRRCFSCDKELTIKVYEDKTYEGGHYFHVWHIPKELVEDMDWARNHPNYVGETDEEVLFEYWECDSCYYRGDND